MLFADLLKTKYDVIMIHPPSGKFAFHYLIQYNKRQKGSAIQVFHYEW